MKLVDVYTEPGAAAVLWQLLAERPAQANISHRQMPSLEQHLAFIASRPYPHWYLADIGQGNYVGAVYLTTHREIGIFILQRYRGNRFGRLAVRMLMAAHPGKFLANVAPGNEVSHQLFRELGGNVIQHTYELEAP